MTREAVVMSNSGLHLILKLVERHFYDFEKIFSINFLPLKSSIVSLKMCEKNAAIKIIDVQLEG